MRPGLDRRASRRAFAQYPQSDRRASPNSGLRTWAFQSNLRLSSVKKVKTVEETPTNLCGPARGPLQAARSRQLCIRDLSRSRQRLHHIGDHIVHVPVADVGPSAFSDFRYRQNRRTNF